MALNDRLPLSIENRIGGLMKKNFFQIVAVLFAFALHAGVETERVYLSGRGCEDAVDWSFVIDKGRRAGEETTIPVPSCWEAQGFGVAQYGFNLHLPEAKYAHGQEPVSDETGVYRHAFDFKKTADACVELVFEAVFTDCEVKLNGAAVGTHQGGFQTFRFDVTDAIREGRNELEVTVRKESANRSVNLAERRGDYWVFGGIWRPVYLEVLPKTHIDRITIVAGADGVLKARLYANDGTAQSVIEKYDNPKLWTAETPHLYTKTFALTNAQGEVLHEVTKRFGFRTIEARGKEGLYLNGRRVFVKGVNRHAFRPETGRTLSRTKNLEDVKLIKSMNMNAVRLAHYQADPDFLDLCDEYGLYVENELTSWQAVYDNDIGKRLVAEMVTRDQTHPCVIWWSNGNEGGFNFALDGEFAKGDPSGRAVLHPWAASVGYHTRHYRNYRDMQRYLNQDFVFMPTEFQHGLYDGGHAAGLGEMWKLMRASSNSAGGFLWDLADAGFLHDGTLDCFGNLGCDGLVGPHHEKSGSYWAVKEIWSSVVPKLVQKDDGWDVELENRYDFLTLDGVRVEKRLLDYGIAQALEAKVYNARNELILTKTFELPASSAVSLAKEDSTSDIRHSSFIIQPSYFVPRLVAFVSDGAMRQSQLLPVKAQMKHEAKTLADGSLEVSWSIICTNAVDLLGVTFGIDESQVASKRWLGKGPYRVWRNRPEGVNFGLWENAYNDTVPGESWIYPEFKGWFADTRWMELKLKNGRILRFELLEKAPAVGVFAPRDGRDNWLYVMPELGLSILEVYPAVGNKCAAAKETGPRGRSVLPSKMISGRVRISQF